MSTILNADDYRRRLLSKITDAVVRTRGTPGYIAANATFDAVRNAKDVATHDKHYRQEAIGFCDGVRRTLDTIRTITHVEPYTRALELSIAILQSENTRQLDGFAPDLREVVTKLGGITKRAA